jgi:CubicO group peptidase (beta-lactamase class C family)
MKYLITSGLIALLLAMPSLPISAAAPVPPEVIKDLLPSHVGAAVLAVDGGEVVFEHCWGIRQLGSEEPITPTTTFRMASVSKQFTATAVLTLVDEGKLSLDDPLSKFFADAPDYWNDITLHHLLTHTSGIPAYEGLVPRGTTLQISDYNVLAMLLDTDEPKFTPGSKWEYSNSAYVLLALVVEQVAKQPYHEYLRAEVLQPLGMKGSVNFLRGINTPPERAYGHAPQPADAWKLADQSVTSATRGDGSVYSSLCDLRLWAQALGNAKGVLSEKTANAMASPQFKTTRDENCHYGYGLFIDEHNGERRLWHSGSTRGFSIMLQRFPDRDATLVILLNCSPRSEEFKEGYADAVVDRLLFGEE